MSPKTGPLIPQTSPQSIWGILYLPRPPESWKATEWYTSSIACVPFLLRNILTLQRSGLTEITIFIDSEETETLSLAVEKDSRITAKTCWITSTNQLKEVMQNRKNRVLFFKGSALHDKKEIRSLLKDEEVKTPKNSPISNEQLELLIETIKTNKEIESVQLLKNSDSFIYISGMAKTHVQEQKDFITLHEQLLKGSGQSHDSTITRLLSRPVSRKLTRFFLNTPIHPNQITLFSFAMGLGSALCFAQGTYQTNIFGSLLLLFSTWVDGADGEIARLKFMETELGGQLDIVCDNIVHFFVFGAIGWGVSEATGDKTYLYLGGVAAFASLASFILLGAIILKKNTGATTPPSGSETSMAEKLANRDFIHFLILMSLINLIHVFIFIAAIGSTVFTVYLIYLRLSQRSS